MNDFRKYRLSLVCEDNASYDTLCDADRAKELCQKLLSDADREHFVVIALSAKLEPIGWHIAHIGTLSISVVHPREVFKFAILANAERILVCHNHPSEDPSPSDADLQITNLLSDAAKILKIDLLDHIIVTREDCFSFAENNML